MHHVEAHSGSSNPVVECAAACVYTYVYMNEVFNKDYLKLPHRLPASACSLGVTYDVIAETVTLASQ